MGLQFRSCCVCLASQTFLFLSADHALYRGDADAKMEERKGLARLLQRQGPGAQREGVAQQQSQTQTTCQVMVWLRRGKQARPTLAEVGLACETKVSDGTATILL